MREGKFKHLTWADRLVIERMLRKNFSKKEIAAAVGCCLKTVYNEINRASYEHTNYDLTTEIRYNPDLAQERYMEGLRRKGAKAKLCSDKKQLRFIENMIVQDKYSPKAVLLHIKKYNLKFKESISSVNTIYSAIQKGYFEMLSLKHLPRRGRNIKRKKKVQIQKRAPRGTSIEKRPKAVDDRILFGHWEMDCVEGRQKNKKTLLVLTERKTRYEIIEQLKSHTTSEVIKALNRIEKRFKSSFFDIFKTITVDNGHEFNDEQGMQKALYRIGDRTKIYYCHPYAPHERGSNENQNHLVRRFFPKGSDFDKTINRNIVKEAEYWINTYPRDIFNGDCPLDKFNKEIKALGFDLLI